MCGRAFGEALVHLKKGELAERPIQSQFGFLVIKLEDTREGALPAFEDVKPQLVQRLTQGGLQRFQQDLRNAAQTDYKFSQP